MRFEITTSALRTEPLTRKCSLTVRAKSLTDEDDLVRAKSLTDEDLDELKGCFDLGFGFSYDEIPELCNTLPALELCYSMSQKFLDDQKSLEVSPPVEETVSPPPAPIASWKISSPGEFFFFFF
ncbi:hypothetical protein HanHA300_Chr00c0107g0710901 [Helianthus annuus]|nr:hypothetical protein HanHA300_Chr00c0107g0710901 [Helianthus annuus]KAJ0819716.1 hypothetical protein HanPSC8_Chr16g0699251 [Helianthus annuus]